MIKTLIELFDACQVENVIAGLKFKPERIVYVGFESMMESAKQEAIKSFFIKKGVDVELIFEGVETQKYPGVVEKLNKIIDTYPECCFDLTGGKEIVLTAMGAVSALRSIPMIKFDVETGLYESISGSNADVLSTPSVMTIKEGIELNGCSVIYNEKGDVNWDFNSDFINDIKDMWEIARFHCGSWNRQSKEFEFFDSLKNTSNGIFINENTYLNDRILSGLQDKGLISGYDKDSKVLNLRYKNNQIRKCLTKAGNILELMVYSLLREIENEEAGYYDDIDLSVYMDWDGIIHNKKDDVKDTKNEIDVMVMRDLIPVFISCKNGEVHKESLYELDTVAKRFGGKYARKVMIATYISSDPVSNKYFFQRAKDMNIILLHNVNEKTRDELKDDLKLLIK